jgi:CRP-like cAMP-binding protein
MSRDQHAALHASPSPSYSAGRFRKHRAGGASSNKGRQQQLIAASPASSAGTTSATTATATANGWMALLAHSDANPEIARAVQMCSLYPALRVAGTAFENSLNMAHRLSTESFTLLSSSRRGTELSNGGSGFAAGRDDMPHSPRMSSMVFMETSSVLREAMETSSVLREATEEWRALHDGNGNNTSGGGNNLHGRNSVLATSNASADAVSRTMALNSGTKMVQMACAMKRAAMWEVVVVTALAHRAMELKFRRDRLRRVLERHLLPTLMERKKTTGSVISKKGGAPRRSNNDRNLNDAASNGSSAGADGGAAPQGSYLREHNAFLASLNSPVLLQSFAETMTRHRFLPGEVIARAGQLSQKVMYFLISGKCEVTRNRSEGAAADALDTSTGNTDLNNNSIDNDNDTAATPTYRDGMHSTKAPRTRPCGVMDNAVSRCVKEVIMPGATFGGIISGSSAVFAETYRALSQCIIWELRAEDFESVFRPFSDRAMLDKYKEYMRAHSLAWLQQHYHPAKVFGSIPVYRKLASRKSRYLGDFTPVVKVRGELLFAQDDLPGDVYCLLEGTVLRRTKAAGGGHGDDGVAQRLATNAFTSLRAVGRFLLLGEEPHVLPGVQPYSCTVSSRVALFYKVPGERFVSALLDDPSLYSQLRERLMRQRQASMVLRPECLAFVPLLQRFPPEKRAELLQYAQPRVVGRSTPLCEPAQHLSELMLVVSGDVCDPRRYGQKPTRALKKAVSGESGAGGEGGTNANDGSNGGGASAATAVATTTRLMMNGPLRNKSNSKPDRRGRDTAASAVMNSSAGFVSDVAGGAAPATGAKRRAVTGSKRVSAAVKRGAGDSFVADDIDSDDDDVDDGDVEGHRRSPEVTGVDWNFSLTEAQVAAAVGATRGGGGGGNAGAQRADGVAQSAAALQHERLCQAAAIVYPDESEEINPPPPSQPSRSFVYALGGSWEALLLEKWPNGWETTSTVALWAIPTYKLRLVYNSCTKATQSSILNGLRLAQKEDQQLPSIPHTKLPPMAVYTQRAEAPVVPGTTVETSSQSTSKASLHRRRAKRQPLLDQTLQQQQAPQHGAAPSLPFAVPAEVAPSFYKSAVEVSAGAAASPEGDPLSSRGKPLQCAAKSNTATFPRTATANAKLIAVVGQGSAAKNEVTATSGQPSPQGPSRNAPVTTSLPSTPFKPKHLGGTDSKGTKRTPRQKVEGNSAFSSGTHAAAMRYKTHKVAVPAPPTPITTIDPAVKAAYDGVFDAADPVMLRIVRDPAVVPAASNQRSDASAKRAAALAERSLPLVLNDSGCTDVSPITTDVLPTAWPAQTPARDRWFQAVPSYEPLPGTMHAAETRAAPPVFAPNSTVLASAGIGSSRAHGKTLESHVAYYAANNTSPSVASTRRGDAAGDGSVGASPHPLPKRRAYAA